MFFYFYFHPIIKIYLLYSKEKKYIGFKWQQLMLFSFVCSSENIYCNFEHLPPLSNVSCRKPSKLRLKSCQNHLSNSFQYWLWWEWKNQISLVIIVNKRKKIVATLKWSERLTYLPYKVVKLWDHWCLCIEYT